MAARPAPEAVRALAAPVYWTGRVVLEPEAPAVGVAAPAEVPFL